MEPIGVCENCTEHCKHETAARRLRVLDEASRGLETTDEHLEAKRLMKRAGGRVVSEVRPGKRVRSVWFKFEVVAYKPKYEYVEQEDGSVLEIANI